MPRSNAPSNPLRMHMGELYERGGVQQLRRHIFAYQHSATDEEYLGWIVFLNDEAEHYRNTIGVIAE